MGVRENWGTFTRSFAVWPIQQKARSVREADISWNSRSNERAFCNVGGRYLVSRYLLLLKDLKGRERLSLPAKTHTRVTLRNDAGLLIERALFDNTALLRTDKSYVIAALSRSVCADRFSSFYLVLLLCLLTSPLHVVHEICFETRHAFSLEFIKTWLQI